MLTTAMDSEGFINITDEVIQNSIQERKALFDKTGDSHYDNISGFIKSMRGSDPDATVFYLARAINGGEDPVFLARSLASASFLLAPGRRYGNSSLEKKSPSLIDFVIRVSSW